ncbi:MAG TPA: hypothetical protein VFG83_14255 [Kofleriaceae bacterium]|nr:hypothetical protein [Kofleriaceae bacterium]
MIRRIAIATAVAAVLAGSATGAGAKSQRSVHYAYDQVFSTAVRFLRIDEGDTITETNREAGYILFTLTDDGKEYSGALELVRRDDAVAIFLRLAKRPSYMERGMLARLEQKLREQLGRPRRERPAPKPENQPEGGTPKPSSP